MGIVAMVVVSTFCTQWFWLSSIRMPKLKRFLKGVECKRVNFFYLFYYFISQSKSFWVKCITFSSKTEEREKKDNYMSKMIK